MSELCLTSTSKTHFSSLLISDFFLFFSFVLSHPLYLSYFIFFSPYLLKLLSFLSPLFITTSLLLLSLLTLSPRFINDNSFNKESSKEVSFLTTTYHAVIKGLRSKMENDQEFLRLEDFEVFKFVFDNPMMDGDARCSQVEVLVAESKDSSFQDFSLTTKEALKVELENFAELETKWSIMDQEENILDGFLDEFENVKVTATSVEKKKSNPPSTKSNKAVEKQDNGQYNLGSYGSMRKEKDWKRTLACKLFEERNNEDDLGEGMDLLWETYETESSKSKANSKSKKKSNNKKKYHEEIEYKGHDDEEEDESDGQLCCLQALKFSAGKMNLGMGKPNLVKISKAIKGIGWLHNLGSRRHSKKVHNGDRF